MVALAIPIAVARVMRSLPPGVYGLGVYAALAAGAFALVGDAPDTPLSSVMIRRSSTDAGRPWLPAYAAVLATAAWMARHLRASSEAGRRWLSVASWLGWSALLLTGALAAVAVLLPVLAAPNPQFLVALSVAAAGLGATWAAAKAGTAGMAPGLVLATLLSAAAARWQAPRWSALPVWILAGVAPSLLALADLLPWPGKRDGHQLALAFAAAAMVALGNLEVGDGAVLPLTTAFGAATAVLAHLRGRAQPTWHAVAAAIALATVVLGAGPTADPRAPGMVAVVLSVVYGAVGWWQRERDAAQATALEDLSLVGFGLSLVVTSPLLFALAAPAQVPADQAWLASTVVATLPFWLAAAGLVARGPLDKSAAPVNCGVLFAGTAALMVAMLAQPAWLWAYPGVAAVLATLVAAVTTPAIRVPVLGRALMGRFELSFAWSGHGAVAQGFGLASLGFIAMAVLANLLWCGTDRLNRDAALVGSACTALAVLLGFATRAWAGVNLRGRVGVLFAFGAAIVLVALTNRLGRPLPPLVVARNLTLVGIGLWLLAHGAVRVGPRVAARLGAPDGEGERYHSVAHVGVAALVVLLLLDAWWMPALPLDRGLAVVPPLMLLGPAVLLILLGRSFRQPWLAAPAAVLVAVGAMLVTGQGGLLGAQLRQWDPPNGVWMPVGVSPFLHHGAQNEAYYYYGGPGAVTARWGQSLLGLGGAAVAFGALAALVVRRPGFGEHLVQALWRRDDPTDRSPLYLLATLAALLTAGSVFGIAIVRDWSQAWAFLPTDAGIATTRLALAVAAAACWVQLDAAAALAERYAATAAALIAGLCLAYAGGPWLANDLSPQPDDAALALAAVCAGLALAHQTVAFAVSRRLEDHSFALAAARDMLLVGGAAAVGAWCGADRLDPGQFAAHLGLASLAACAIANAWAFAVERRALHVYLLQCALVGSYAVLRQTWLRSAGPEDDAAVLLSIGFLLVGATVAARRAHLDHAADAVRRFAGLLPLGMGAALPWQATTDNALWSLGAAGMYGLLGKLGGSRAMSALGAVAANLALVQAAITQGFAGFEVWFGAFGLLVAVLSHLYADVLESEVRGALRLVGAGLGYIPAAAALVWQIGDAQNDGYPLGLAAACLAGVTIGAALRVRAYLLLGAGFLLLDLATVLVRASLRDQRLGFVALSSSGLLVLALMVLWSTRRAQVQATVRRIQRVLARWQ